MSDAWKEVARERETEDLVRAMDVADLVVAFHGYQDRIEALEAEVGRLREALRNLVKMNEEHNAAIEAVIGRPLNWSDNYLDEARAALAGEGDKDE
jgi:hypothetical protein